MEDKGFHLKLAGYFMKRVLPFCKGRILDLGCGVAVITKALVDAGFEVVGIDGNEDKIEIARNKVPKAKFLVTLFEDFNPNSLFDTIISKNVLEHLTADKSRVLVKKMFSWLNPKGRAIAYVPNALSLNRRIGYHMGISKFYAEPTQEDIAVGHVQLYTREKLELEFNAAGFKTVECKGLLLKPFPNPMMELINERICDALFEVANDARLGDLCSGIYIIGEKIN